MTGVTGRVSVCCLCHRGIKKSRWVVTQARWTAHEWLTRTYHLTGPCGQRFLQLICPQVEQGELEGVHSLPTPLFNRVLSACNRQEPLRKTSGVHRTSKIQSSLTYTWRRWSCPPGVLIPGRQADGEWDDARRVLTLWVRRSTEGWRVDGDCPPSLQGKGRVMEDKGSPVIITPVLGESHETRTLFEWSAADWKRQKHNLQLAMRSTTTTIQDHQASTEKTHTTGSLEHTSREPRDKDELLDSTPPPLPAWTVLKHKLTRHPRR